MTLALVVFIATFTSNTYVYSTSSFEGRETEMDTMCSNWDTYSANRTLCAEYKTYLEQKKQEANNELNNIKGSINDIQGDINKDTQSLNELQDRITDIESQIKKTDSQIASTESKIKQTEEEIVVKEKDIEEKEVRVEAYMINLQSSLRVNSYVEFIMGAEDFSEVSRRIAGISQINEFNQELIRQLNEEKAVLEETKLSLEFDKENLVTMRADQVTQKSQVEELARVAEQRVTALRSAYAALVAEQERALETQRIVSERIQIPTPVEPSTGGLMLPVSSFRISEVQWYYGDGGKHMGVDFARVPGSSILGASIVAPANGLVIASNSGCATNGSFGCGSGFGNYVLMIMNVNGQIYGGLFGHMQQGSVTVRAGSSVSQGQKIGAVGNSGNSYGAHLHMELYYLGNDSVTAAYNRWYDRGANINFNTGSASYGNEYANRCSVKGKVDPCRLDVAQEYGISKGYVRP